MLTLYESQRLEVLADLFIDRLASWANDGLLDLFRPETVVPQNPVIGRWLSGVISRRIGISGNLTFPLAGRLIRDLLESAYGDPAKPVHFDKESLLLRLYSLLPSLLAHPAFFPVRTFLGGEVSDKRLYDLSVILSDLYDRSMIYRPELLLSWEEARDPPDWPGILWQLIAGSGRPLHRARMMEQSFRSNGEELADLLPPRLSLFGLTGMAPRDLQFFRMIGENGLCDLHLYFLNPCEEYWGDIVAARVRNKASEERAPYLDSGSPLLSSWGEQFRVIHQIYSDLPLSVRHFPPADDTLLGWVQEDLRMLTDRGASIREGVFSKRRIPRSDRSIEVVRCPSPVREIEMLKDHLLDLFSNDPALTPDEIVVLAPDITRYAGIIRSVFGGDDGPGIHSKDPSIPFVISDRRELLEEPHFLALLLLLRLSEERLTAPLAFRLLSVPALARRFGLSLVRPSRLKQILEQSGFRWGREGGDRPPPYANRREHTLAEGRDRLLLGYAFGEEWQDPDAFPLPPLALPDDPEGEIAGGIALFLESLDDLAVLLSEPVPASEWPARLNDLFEAFFDLDSDNREVSELRALPERLAQKFGEAGFDERLSARVVARHLERVAKSGEGRDRFFTGGVTFGQMVPLRSIPFRIVCLIGMNDADFPRSSWPPSFDWLAAQPAPGDRSLREDDRTLFLEALLSARSALWISFVGVEIRDGSAREPSVLVRQLLDVLEEGFAGEEGTIASQVLLDAPIDPLSPAHFDGTADPRLRSYSRSWYEALAVSRERPHAETVFFDPDLVWPKSSSTSGRQGSDGVAIAELRAFFRNPSRTFLTRRLALPASTRTPFLEEEEPFIAARTRLLARSLQDPHLSPGDLPWSPLREIAKDALKKEREAYRHLLSREIGHSEEPLLESSAAIIDAPFFCDRIYGTIEGFVPHAQGRLLVIEHWPFRLGASDLLEGYLLHLLGSLFLPEYAGLILTGRAEKAISAPPVIFPAFVSWPRLDASSGARILFRYLRAYKCGMSAPLPFDPEASRVYSETFAGPSAEAEEDLSSLLERATERARSAFFKRRQAPPKRGEAFEDPRIFSYFWSSLAFAGRDLPGEPPFRIWSRRLWDPIIEISRDREGM